MIKRNKRNKPNNKKFYRLNERITAFELRVLDAKGEQIGLLKREEALAKAKGAELDLVEIAPTAKPPVARIINFNKFLYQEEKKRRETKKKAKSSDTKEVRLGPFMDSHDLETRLKRAREFLEDNDKVKLVVRFKGRQMGHPEFGHKTIGIAIEMLSDVSKVDKEPRFEGRQLIAMLSPERKKHEKEQNESKEVSEQAVQSN